MARTAFVLPDGSRFFIRGVDYQPGGAADPVDPIADGDGCRRDIQEFTKLGINTVRVYSVDNTAQHDDCMNQLSQAGIYLALDVNSKGYSINRADPSGSYNDVYLQSVFATIDSFKKYDNTLLFFSGNEVINAPNNTNTAPYIKAVTRDMKAYIAKQSQRPIPVGYSAADVESNRVQTAHYMNCGPDDVRADLFAFNDYSWCGEQSSYTVSGWNQRVQEYQNYGLPLFLSEFGCNTIMPRTFPEIGALYGPQMTGVYSGGLVYEYSQEDSNYGLVDLTDPQNPKELKDFGNLQNQYQKNPMPTSAPAANPNGGPSQCPPQDSNWEPGMPDTQLPAMPAPAQKLIDQGAGQGPGLQGSSQSTGVGSTQNVTIAAGSSGSGSGTSQASKSSGTGNAAAGLAPVSISYGPIGTGLAVVLSSIVGALLL